MRKLIRGWPRSGKYELLPLLEEHHFGQLSRETIREKFGVATLRRKASSVGGLDAVVSDPGKARA